MRVLVVGNVVASILHVVRVSHGQEHTLVRGRARRKVFSSPLRPLILAARIPTIVPCMLDAAPQSKVPVTAPAVIARPGQAARVVLARILRMVGPRTLFAEAARHEDNCPLTHGHPLYRAIPP